MAAELSMPWPVPEWLGRVEYLEALERQRERRELVVTGGPEAVWLLEHDPVVTTGRRSVQDLDRSKIRVPIVETERGGLATYHGPGQLVGYLMIDVGRRRGTVRGTIRAVEQGVIDWLRGEGIDGGRREGFPGVWVGSDKICAIGMHFRRGVAMHGFALNLDVDLGGFSGFVPCGVSDGGVTSVARVRGTSGDPASVAHDVGGRVVCALAAEMRGRVIDTSSDGR